MAIFGILHLKVAICFLYLVELALHLETILSLK